MKHDTQTISIGDCYIIIIHAAVVRIQNNHIIVCCLLSAPQWSSGSSFRSGLWTHLRLLKYAVFQSAHQKQRPLPGKSCPTSRSQQFKKKKAWHSPYPLLPCFSLSQTFSSSLLSSEFSLTFSPASGRCEGCEVKGEGEPEARRLDHCFMLKRKRRSTAGEADKGGLERNDDHKRSKSGELFGVCAQTRMCTLSVC